MFHWTEYRNIASDKNECQIGGSIVLLRSVTEVECTEGYRNSRSVGLGHQGVHGAIIIPIITIIGKA